MAPNPRPLAPPPKNLFADFRDVRTDRVYYHEYAKALSTTLEARFEDLKPRAAEEEGGGAL